MVPDVVLYRCTGVFLQRVAKSTNSELTAFTVIGDVSHNVFPPRGVEYVTTASRVTGTYVEHFLVIGIKCRNLKVMQDVVKARCRVSGSAGYGYN